MNYDPSIEYRLVSKKENWSFVPIWKNGTKTVFQAFAEMGRLPKISDHHIHSFLWSDPNNPYFDDVCFMHKDSKEYNDFKKTAFNFVIVRDPIERALSNIYHKLILDPGGNETADFLDKYSVKDADDSSKIIAFVAYLELNYPNVDPHFLSQNILANLSDSKFDMIIDLKNLQESWNVLSNRYSNIPKIDNSNNNVSKKYENALYAIKDKKTAHNIKNRLKQVYKDDYFFIRHKL